MCVHVFYTHAYIHMYLVIVSLGVTAPYPLAHTLILCSSDCLLIAFSLDVLKPIYILVLK